MKGLTWPAKKKKKKELRFVMVMPGAKGKNIFLSPETARELK